MQGWRIVLWVMLVIAFVWFIYLVRDALLPFIISFIVSALLDPTVRKLRLRGMSRRWAVSVVMTGFFAVVVTVGFLVTPGITRETRALSIRAEDLVASATRDTENDNFFLRWNPAVQAQQSPFTTQVDELLAKNSSLLERVGLPSSRREIMEQYVDKNRPQIARMVQNLSNSFFGILTGIFSQLPVIFLVPILVPLILMDMDNFRRRGPRWIPPAIRASTMSILGDIGQVFVKYLRGVTMVALLYALVMTSVLGILWVPAWILLGPLFACLYLVPYFGNIIASVTVFLIVGFSGTTGWMHMPSSWAYALIVMGAYFVVGAFFDHWIYPSLVGNSVGLSPVVSIFVIISGGALFGLPGMLLAFPLAGSAKVILDRLIRVTSVTADNLALPSVPLRHRVT